MPGNPVSVSDESAGASTEKPYTVEGEGEPPSCSAPLIGYSKAGEGIDVVIPSYVSAASTSLKLSGTMSGISAKEIHQRREELRLFSSQLSMASTLSPSRSTNLLPSMAVNYELTPFSSTLSSLSPMCRICQCASTETDNTLISPCRCDGSLKHIHPTCLLVRISAAYW